MEGRVREHSPPGKVGFDVSIFGRTVPLELDAHQVRGPELSEAEYLACCDARRLVSFLHHSPFVCSHRRIVLFACACLRLGWDRLDTPQRRWVEQGETLLDQPGGTPRRQLTSQLRAVLTNKEDAWATWVEFYQLRYRGPVCPGQLFHDVFGNPFRPRMIDPNWLTAQDGAVTRLARDIYDRRAFAEMPVLGDALEDAGCADEGILSHCRGGGLHARGCWLLDALLALE
jgi:hypothetical protein